VADFNRPVKYLVENMGVPLAEARQIRDSVDMAIQLSTDGAIKDYDAQLLRDCIADAKQLGYVEADNGDA